MLAGSEQLDNVTTSIMLKEKRKSDYSWSQLPTEKFMLDKSSA